MFASTIQASVVGDLASDELDEAEIERSIQEINDAIRRSNKRRLTTPEAPSALPLRGTAGGPASRIRGGRLEFHCASPLK